jgi:predicted dehydrogenase
VTTGGAIGVGVLGYAFMGKGHSRAFREARALHAPLVPELVSLSGRTAEKVEAARNGKHVLCEKPLGRTRGEITYRGVEG